MEKNNSKLIEKLRSIGTEETGKIKKKNRPTREEYLQRLKEKVAKLEAKLQGKKSEDIQEIEETQKIEEIKSITEPNPLFIPIVKIPFDVWAESQKIEELRLSDKEAENIALYITQLVDYYLPKIPSIAYAWMGLATSIFAVLQPRLKLIRELKKQKEEKMEEVKTQSE